MQGPLVQPKTKKEPRNPKKRLLHSRSRDFAQGQFPLLPDSQFPSKQLNLSSRQNSGQQQSQHRMMKRSGQVQQEGSLLGKPDPNNESASRVSKKKQCSSQLHSQLIQQQLHAAQLEHSIIQPHSKNSVQRGSSMNFPIQQKIHHTHGQDFLPCPAPQPLYIPSRLNGSRNFSKINNHPSRPGESQDSNCEEELSNESDDQNPAQQNLYRLNQQSIEERLRSKGNDSSSDRLITQLEKLKAEQFQIFQHSVNHVCQLIKQATETAYICKVASKHGLDYRTIIKPEDRIDSNLSQYEERKSDQPMRRAGYLSNNISYNGMGSDILDGESSAPDNASENARRSEKKCHEHAIPELNCPWCHEQSQSNLYQLQSNCLNPMINQNPIGQQPARLSSSFIKSLDQRHGNTGNDDSATEEQLRLEVLNFRREMDTTIKRRVSPHPPHHILQHRNQGPTPIATEQRSMIDQFMEDMVKMNNKAQDQDSSIVEDLDWQVQHLAHPSGEPVEGPSLMSFANSGNQLESPPKNRSKGKNSEVIIRKKTPAFKKKSLEHGSMTDGSVGSSKQQDDDRPEKSPDRLNIDDGSLHVELTKKASSRHSSRRGRDQRPTQPMAKSLVSMIQGSSQALDEVNKENNKALIQARVQQRTPFLGNLWSYACLVDHKRHLLQDSQQKSTVSFQPLATHQDLKGQLASESLTEIQKMLKSSTPLSSSRSESLGGDEEELPLVNTKENFVIVENPNESQGSSRMVRSALSSEFRASSYPNLIRGQANIDQIPEQPKEDLDDSNGLTDRLRVHRSSMKKRSDSKKKKSVRSQTNQIVVQPHLRAHHPSPQRQNSDGDVEEKKDLNTLIGSKCTEMEKGFNGQNLLKSIDSQISASHFQKHVPSPGIGALGACQIINVEDPPNMKSPPLVKVSSLPMREPQGLVLRPQKRNSGYEHSSSSSHLNSVQRSTHLRPSVSGQSRTRKSNSIISGQSESLYLFTTDEKVLLKKCLKRMEPMHFNKIRRSFINNPQAENQKEIYQAVTRMAFERDPDFLIRVTLLEYYSLDKYQGFLTFADGLNKIEFKGGRVDMKQESNNNFSVFSYLMGGNINIASKSSEVFSVKTILGVLMGPHSSTFQEYLKRQFRNKEVQAQKYDQWRFLTILTPMRSYDFILSSKQDCMDLLLAINDAMVKSTEYHHKKKVKKLESSGNENQRSMMVRQLSKRISQTNIRRANTFNTEQQIQKKALDRQKRMYDVRIKQLKINTNTRILRFELTRKKVQHIATDMGYTIGQFLMLGIYNAVASWPELTDNQPDQALLERKYRSLQYLSMIIQKSPRLEMMVDVIDFSVQRKLNITVNKIKVQRILNFDDQDAKVRALRKIMQTIMGVNTFGRSKSLPNSRIQDSQQKAPDDAEFQDNFSINEIFNRGETKKSFNIGHTSPESPGLISKFSRLDERDGSAMARSNFVRWLHGSDMKPNNPKMQQLSKREKAQYERVLKKKLRSLKYLIYLKKRRKKTQEEEKQNPKKPEPFIDALGDHLKKLVESQKKSNPFGGLIKNLDKKKLEAAAAKQQEPDKPKRQPMTQEEFHFQVSDFNYHKLNNKFLEKQRKDIVKWTKRLYFKDNRLVRLDDDERLQKQAQKHLSIKEEELKALKNQTHEDIIENQEKVGSEIKLINRFNDMERFRFYEMPSLFNMTIERPETSRRRESSRKRRKESKKRDPRSYELSLKKRRQELEKEAFLQAEKDKELSVQAILSRDAKVASKANLEQKYEYKRQLKLLKKRIEISLKKAIFDNMDEEEKRKNFIKQTLHQQNSSLVSEDNEPGTSPISRILTPLSAGKIKIGKSQSVRYPPRRRTSDFQQEPQEEEKESIQSLEKSSYSVKRPSASREQYYY